MDRYARFANSPPGRVLVRRLGLPQPPRLHRYTEDKPELDGRVLIGGAGRVADLARKIVPEAVAGGERYRGLVFDATAATDPAGLRAAYEFLGPVLRSLLPGGRVVVVGTPPAAAGSVRAAAAQQALDGFVRSVGKELRAGGTANLVYVAPGAEEAVGSTLRFLLSPRSAYVSGQTVWVSQPVPGPASSGPTSEGSEATGARREDVASTGPGARASGASARVVAVTGAARGIGAAIARVLARGGATVVVVDVPAAGDALSTVANDVRGSALQLDLTRPEAPDRLVRHFTERHGRLDVLVHNAGITRDRTLARMSDAEWDAVLAVNLSSQLAINDAVLAGDLVGAGGRIVSVASVSGIAGNRGQTNYAASKAGVIGLVRALAPEVAPRGVTVNAVAPGFIETRMTAKMPVVVREAGRRMNSMAQGGLPVDVAETVAWLAEPGSAGVTGNVVRVCGQSLIGA
jgi:3-oxoacyl-[acyl-carrier protein] reductase